MFFSATQSKERCSDATATDFTTYDANGNRIQGGSVVLDAAKELNLRAGYSVDELSGMVSLEQERGRER